MSEGTRSSTGTNRLPAHERQVIQRDRPLTFHFDGRPIEAFEGDTIASALHAARRRTLSRSFKYHRPRGLLCATGDCPNCLLQVGDEPNVRACRRRVEHGLQVQSQNRWPSLSTDIFNLVEVGDRFLPPGFYYKAFMRPRFLWPLYETALRRLAGLGVVRAENEEPFREKEYLQADVTVIGGGPAGLQSALAAAKCGARVVLLEAEDALGGHLRFRRGARADGALQGLATRMADQVEAEESIRALTATHAFGWYDHNWLGAASDERLFKIRSAAIVVATGASEIPFVFENNDLPGIMLSGAAQRLIRLWGVRPGQRAVVVSSHRAGWLSALDLLEAGVTVEVVATPEADFPPEIVPLLTEAGLRLAPGAKPLKAEGGRSLKAIWLTDSSHEHRQRYPCDTLIASAGFLPRAGLLYQAGAKLSWHAGVGESIPSELPAGAFAAGGVSGPSPLSVSLTAGAEAGQRAAEHAGILPADHSAEPTVEVPADSTELASSHRTSPPLGEQCEGKSFVCFCEDVTRKDLAATVAEGYDRMELLKRYSTVSMGPCQGKMCNLATMHLCARDTQRTLVHTGSTTSRPPVRPVSLATLAGRPMDPVRRTPLDGWHRRHGAHMMVAGQWMRPEHYGDPLAEVTAVRERVGLIDVSTLGKIHLHGPDVPQLLEFLYTNRWRKLPLGRVRYGLMVNEEGVVMDDGVTAHLADDFYYMSTTSSGATSVYEWIDWWLQSGLNLDVHIVNATNFRAAMNLTGPHARRVLNSVTEGVDLSREAFPYMNARQGRVAGAPALLLRIGFTGELGYEIHVPSGYGMQVWQALMAAGADDGIRPFGVEAQRLLRLEKGHLIVGQDTDSLSNPLEASMGWAVKEEKRDFLGRAALQMARERQDGATRRLVGFEIPGGTLPEEANQIVRPGEGPTGLEILGRITSVRRSPTLDRVIGLAWLPKSMAAAGSEFTVRHRDELIRGVVVDTPFYDPHGERLHA